MAFIKRIENFTCEHCGAFVTGTGYTNHCPVCLWSKHVDKDPGDRAATCGGMMEPVRIEGSTPDYKVFHRCKKCGFTRRNSIGAADSPEAILALVKKQNA